MRFLSGLQNNVRMVPRFQGSVPPHFPFTSSFSFSFLFTLSTTTSAFFSGNGFGFLFFSLSLFFSFLPLFLSYHLRGPHIEVLVALATVVIVPRGLWVSRPHVVFAWMVERWWMTTMKMEGSDFVEPKSVAHSFINCRQYKWHSPFRLSRLYSLGDRSNCVGTITYKER